MGVAIARQGSKTLGPESAGLCSGGEDLCCLEQLRRIFFGRDTMASIWLWINTYKYSLLGDEHP